jgi:cell division protease FtsH
MENYDRAKKIVLSNLDKLKVLAEALLERETLDAADIDVLFAGGTLAPMPPVAAFPGLSRNSEQAKGQRPEGAATSASYPIVPPAPEKA